MQRLKFAARDDLSGLKNAAPGVTPGGTHCMMAYRNSAEQVAILHLWWDKNLCNDPPSGHFALWAEPDLEDENAVMVSALCESIVTEAGPLIRYAFSDPRSYFRFDSNKLFVANAGQIGLTCATFVLAVFDCLGLELVAYNTWPDKAGARDLAEREKLFKDLVKEVPDHARIAEAELKSTRYHPLQVLAAATGRPPMKHARARRAASAIRKMLPKKRT